MQKDTEEYDNVCFDNKLSLTGSMNVMLKCISIAQCTWQCDEITTGQRNPITVKLQRPVETMLYTTVSHLKIIIRIPSWE